MIPPGKCNAPPVYNVRMDITTTDRLQNTRGIKAIVYGVAGSGKTMLTASAPSPFLFSVEGGTSSLSRHNIKRVFGDTPHSESFPVVEINTIQELWEAIQWMQSAEAHQYSVCVDSLTNCAELWLQHIRATSSNPKDARSVFGEFNSQFIAVCNLMQRLPQPVIMTCKLDRETDVLTDAILYRPLMPGQQVPLQLPHIFDQLFCLRIDPQSQNARYLQTQADAQYTAKDRSGILDAMEYPNLTLLMQKLLSTH